MDCLVCIVPRYRNRARVGSCLFDPHIFRERGSPGVFRENKSEMENRPLFPWVSQRRQFLSGAWRQAQGGEKGSYPLNQLRGAFAQSSFLEGLFWTFSHMPPLWFPRNSKWYKHSGKRVLLLYKKGRKYFLCLDFRDSRIPLKTLVRSPPGQEVIPFGVCVPLQVPIISCLKGPMSGSWAYG